MVKNQLLRHIFSTSRPHRRSATRRRTCLKSIVHWMLLICSNFSFLSTSEMAVSFCISLFLFTRLNACIQQVWDKSESVRIRHGPNWLCMRLPFDGRLGGRKLSVASWQQSSCIVERDGTIHQWEECEQRRTKMGWYAPTKRKIATSRTDATAAC